MIRSPALIAIAALAALAAAGCSAGRVTQTSVQVATVDGASADLDQLSLRNIRFVYPEGGSYQAGDDAELALVVTNQGLEEDTLIGVTGDFFDGASLVSSGSGSSGGGDEGLDAPVPAQGSLIFGTDDDPAIEVSDLSDDLVASQIVSVTFVFESAGEVTVDVPVANPTEEIERGEGYDFHEEEGGEG